MINKPFLATTALQDFWDRERDEIQFLGTWCMLYDRKDNWENLNACGTLVGSPFRESPLAYVPLTTSERQLRYDILRYNLFYSFRPQSIYKILKERIGPAGWLTLPERWYFKIEEWAYLMRFGFRILCSFVKIFLYSLIK